MLTEEMELLERINEKYEGDVTLNPPKNPDELKEFEQKTGVHLPQELRAFYQLTNGFYSFHAYMNLWELERIEQHWNDGYNDWFEQGDGSQYLVLGSTGCCEYLLMKIATGQYLRYGDEGEITPIDSIKDLMCWNIDSLYDEVRDLEEDERINAYLEANADKL